MSKDLQREKFAAVISEVEDLESDVERLERKMLKLSGKDKAAAESTLSAIRERLAERRNELKRLSDGCGAHGV